MLGTVGPDLAIATFLSLPPRSVLMRTAERPQAHVCPSAHVSDQSNDDRINGSLV